MPERGVGKVRKKLPIGIENFEEFSTEDFYYVHKGTESKFVYSSQTVWKDLEYEYAEAFFRDRERSGAVRGTEDHAVKGSM